MIVDEPVTLGERYVTAASSSNLAPSGSGLTDLDVVAAAGLAARKNPNWANALRLRRLVDSGDMNGLYLIVDHCDHLLQHFARKGQRHIPKSARRALIVDVLQWMVHMTCDYCGGTGMVSEDGEDGLGKLRHQCGSCHGHKTKPLARAVPHAHVKLAHWLVDTLNQHSTAAMKHTRAMARRGPQP